MPEENDCGMNKKITVRNEGGLVRYCILSGEANLQDQFNLWYYGDAHPYYGIHISVNSTTVAIEDYYHAEVMASFEILSMEDTEEDIIHAWVDPVTKETGW
jgi:hypothetical protein